MITILHLATLRMTRHQPSGTWMSTRSVPAPPRPPPELTKSGKPWAKKERKEVCHLYVLENREIDHTLISERENGWAEKV